MAQKFRVYAIGFSSVFTRKPSIFSSIFFPMWIFKKERNIWFQQLLAFLLKHKVYEYLLKLKLKI